MSDGTEQEFEQILEALGGVEAPPGLEGRVLTRLAEVRGKRRLDWVRSGALGMATCGIAAAVWMSVERSGSVNGRAGDTGPASAPVRLAPTEASVAGHARWDAAGRSLRLATKQGPGRVARELQVEGERLPEQSAEERLAMEEMRAPSMPEAPVPMTEQERLLVRVAQGRGSEAWVKTEVADEDAGKGKDAGEDEVKVARTREAGEDFASVLQAGLFAGMKASDE